MEPNTGWTVGKLLNTASGYWQPCALHAAVKLDIFTLLGDKWRSLAEMNDQVEGSHRGLSALLNALTAMGLLRKDNEGRYANGEFSRTFLSSDSPQYKGHIIMHHHHLVDGWAKLDQAVLSGRPVEKRSHGEEKERESFQLGMFNLAMEIAPKISAEIDLADRHHLLDLGGGPGTYAIHFCLANPKLKATVFDRPTTQEYARKTAEKFGVADRVDFMAGDFNVDRLRGRYDVAWLSQILHSNGPEECERLIAKTVAVMEPGGVVLIHEFFLNDALNGPLFAALFSLNMLVNNEAGRSYADGEVRSMLIKAGIRDIKRYPFRGPNDSYIIGGIV